MEEQKTPAEMPQEETGPMSLEELPVGSSGIIQNVEGEGQIRRRLFDMGLTPGCEVFVRKRAPLGDPVEITLRGYELTLRKKEASLVIVEKEESEETQNG